MAESTSPRLEAVRDLVLAYAAANRYDQGLAFLETVANQFETHEALATLDALRQEVRQRKAAWIEHELAVVRRGAEQMEAKAAAASSAGKEELRKICEHHARFYRRRENELLTTIQQ